MIIRHLQILDLANLLSSSFIKLFFIFSNFSFFITCFLSLVYFIELTKQLVSIISLFNIFLIFLLNILISSANINPSIKSLFDRNFNNSIVEDTTISQEVNFHSDIYEKSCLFSQFSVNSITSEFLFIKQAEDFQMFENI